VACRHGHAIAVSILIAIPVRRGVIPFIAVNTVSGALYTILSLAMFAFLPRGSASASSRRDRAGRLLPAAHHPQHGGRPVGFRAGPEAVGMGLTRRQRLKVELPWRCPRSSPHPAGGAWHRGHRHDVVCRGGGPVLIVNDGIQRGLFVTPHPSAP
jgi:hypothetical protein